MIELHTSCTANGYKASIMLEETALPYRVRDYDMSQGEHQTPGYLAINPVGRIPAIVDDEVSTGAAGSALCVYGSAAILLYLAEKSGRLLPRAAAERAKVFEWLGVISSDLAPAYSGQYVFSHIAPEEIPWAIEYYDKMCLRFLAVLDNALGRTDYLAGDEYTIADVITYPVVATSVKRFPGSLDGYRALARWAAQVGARPAVERGMRVPR